MEVISKKCGTLIHLFRHDIRLHDMPSLSAALEDQQNHFAEMKYLTDITDFSDLLLCNLILGSQKSLLKRDLCYKFSLKWDLIVFKFTSSSAQHIFDIYPVYIFDSDDIAFKRLGYNRLRFILDALKDIDEKLRAINGRLYVFHGKPTIILSELFKLWNVTHLSYEHDIQPNWQKIEKNLQEICKASNIEIIEKSSHTLWKTEDILKANGGNPPVTYSVFCQVAESLGPPSRPEPSVSFEGITIPSIEVPDSDLPTYPEKLGISMECEEQKNKIWIGGETCALQHLKERLRIEEDAYNVGYFMPNQLEPNLLGPPMSMSAALSLGCLSVKKFYWSLRDLYETINPEDFIPDGLVGQLIWREYFYAMCINNPHYGSMKDNPICLNIPWASDKYLLQCWEDGQTGFPFIDAVMRQLKQEGWVHHIGRNAVACFLTRGDLWISWEEGFKVFMKYLLDADLPVCAGNWMWVSSSAFETVLQCSACISPITYGRRFEPSGQYIKKYVPELKNMPLKLLFQPWLASQAVQEAAGCIIGRDYPRPIIDHQEACAKNAEKMLLVKQKFLPQSIPKHCAPSNSAETRLFMCLPKNCIENLLTQS